MTLKGRGELIDALPYLKISGSLVVASTEVSGYMCVRVGLLGRVACFVETVRVQVCVCVCAGTCVVPPPFFFFFIVKGENPQSLGGCRKSDVNRE